MRKGAFLLALTLALALAHQATAGLALSQKTLRSKTKVLEISIRYPKSDVAAIDTVLARYAQSFGADAKSWHFLTGTVSQIHQVAAMFGMDFWNTDGLLTHTLHTVVIDRNGRLAANIDGNQFTARQLGDLVKAVMGRLAGS